MKYKDHAKQQNTTLQTGIHTRINDVKRISSCYRKFSNGHFEQWGWETFLWDGDHIKEEYSVLDSGDEVINLHTKILEKQLKGE